MTTLLLATLLALLPAGAPMDDHEAGGEGALVARSGDVTFGRTEYGEWLVQRQGVVNLRGFVLEQLTLQVAEEQGLLPSDETVAAAYAEDRRMMVEDFHKGDEERYDQVLRRQGYEPATWAALRSSQIRLDLCREALALKRRVIADDAIEARFDDIYGPDGEYTVIEVLFFNMYSGDTVDRTALKSAARERAEFACKALASGTSLEDLRATSDAVGSAFVVDGRVDPYRRQLLGPEVEQAVSSLDDPGEISPPVEVYNGYYVVRLASRDDVSLDDVRHQIVELLENEPVSSEEIAAAEADIWERYPVEFLLR